MKDKYQKQSTKSPARAIGLTARHPTHYVGVFKAMRRIYKKVLQGEIVQSITKDVFVFLGDLIAHGCIILLALSFISLIQAALDLFSRYSNETTSTTIALTILATYSETAIVVSCTFIISQRLLKLFKFKRIIQWLLKRRGLASPHNFVSSC
jgi:hypothetical protein